jgi:D-alanyl-lipoteichoic acid acyltransferase DltB (MBOAT superfamily)
MMSPEGKDDTSKPLVTPRPSSPTTNGGGEVRPCSLLDIGFITLQLLLALAVIYQFQLESRTFFQVMLLAVAGFVVHALLPLPYRLPFFVALSLAAIVLAMGVLDGVSVIVLGMLLIGICHLPIRMARRVLMLIGTAVIFALWRIELMAAPWSIAVWPILASMFMFRLALYLHALKYDEKRPTVASTLSYFFMLPNVCFPLFPVIDYSTFRRTYYDRDAMATYAIGVKWIARGLVHLIIYRFVYVYLAGDPTELRSLGDLVQFLLATFLLYLRVSGQFHLITGILHLYGFRLPETHHLYYLASSFTDFWRRINIYWKDFMMKLVYYPCFFRLRRFGGNLALVVATAAVFLATWLLHSYQWFWLRGEFPLALQDGLFWGILGALVVFGALREMKRSRPRKLSPSAAWSPSLAVRTVGTFTVICVLWSLWSAESVTIWLLMWSAAGTVETYDLWVLLALLGLGLLIGGKPWSVSDPQVSDGQPLRWRTAALSTATLVFVLVVGQTGAYSWVAPRAAFIVASLQRSTLNARDAAEQHKGYYENLDNPSRQSAQLWEVRAKKPSDWIAIGGTPAYRGRGDFLGAELVPNSQIQLFGKPLTTNQWGMRDRERAREKPANTYRIALLGPSHVMGSGVSDEETIARILEDRLNESPDLRGMRYEVLNFGVSGYALTNQLAMLNDRALSFKPDAVFVVDAPSRIPVQIVQHFMSVIPKGREIPFPALAAAVAETGANALGKNGIPVPFAGARLFFERLGIDTRMPWHEAEQRLRSSADRLVGVTLEQIAALARGQGAVPVFVALDVVVDSPTLSVPALEEARRSGFIVLDLSGLWLGRDAPRLRIAEWDNHPNADANRLVADRLSNLVRQHRSELRLPLDSR